MNVVELSPQQVNSVEGGSLIGDAIRILVEEVIIEGVKYWIKHPESVVSSGWDSTPYGHYGGARP